MCPNVKLFLFKFDFIGMVPQFRILKYDSYKSIFSSIISIIITIASIVFSIYSVIDYLKFNNPTISYLKRYDNALNNTIFLKDTLFMFRFSNLSNSDFNFNVQYYSKFKTIKLNVERCQIGKNINNKFKDDLEKKYNNKINEYYCISSEHGNLSLFSNHETFQRENYIQITILRDNNTCLSEIYSVQLITENDNIEHDNKTNPVIASSSIYYQYLGCGSFFFMDYKFDFIKYENDVGYFFNNYKNFTSVRTSEISVEKKDGQNIYGRISIKQSERYYSHYKRCYQKIQSLLADIMSIINILIEVGKAISNILLQKKMNKDIIRSLLNMNINNEVKEHSLIENNRIKKKLFNNLNKGLINSERKKINNYFEGRTNNRNNRNNSNKFFNLPKNNLFLEENINRKKMITTHILKKINFFDIIKSYFCFKDKNSNFINICNNFVKKDLCVEIILGRLYELEKIFNLLSKEERSKLNLFIDKKFSKLSNYINEIYIELKKKNYKKINKINIETNDKKTDENNII